MSLMQRKAPACIPRAYDEPAPVGDLYAVESDAGSEGWLLECRTDERGVGTPLIWMSLEAAEQWVKEVAEDTGCYGGQRVVVFGLWIRRDPPARCMCCGKWGHDEALCTNEDRDHTCVNGESFEDAK
jgi:hypothetical protein